MNNNLWTEKYRPKDLNDVLSQSSLISTLQKSIEKNGMQHLLFYGPPGSGKTSSILACGKYLYKNNISMMTLMINASEERGIDTIRTRVQQFINTRNIWCPDISYKLIILDEADALTSDAQAMLRKVIEDSSAYVRFCLICNYIKKIIPAIQSRCVCYRFSPIDNVSMNNKLKYIAKTEKIHITHQAIELITKASNGDMRNAINVLQTASLQQYTKLADIQKCLGMLDITISRNIIYNLTHKDTSFKHCVDYITKVKTEYIYTLTEIIKDTSDRIIQCLSTGCDNVFDEYQDEELLDILVQIGTIENNLSNCSNDNIQLCGFVGIFKNK